LPRTLNDKLVAARERHVQGIVLHTLAFALAGVVVLVVLVFVGRAFYP